MSSLALIDSSSPLIVGNTYSSTEVRNALLPSGGTTTYIYRTGSRGNICFCYATGTDDDGNIYSYDYPLTISSVTSSLFSSDFAVYSTKPSYSLNIWINES